MARPALRRAPIASAQQGLRLFKVAQNREILIALDARGPSTRSDLSRWLVASSRTKLGECLKELVEAGVVEEQDGRARTFALTTAGQHLVAIIDLVSDWFRSHPERPIDPSSPLGWRAFSAVADCWQSVIIEWIVRTGPTPKDVAAGIPGLTRHQLKAELDQLEGARVVELRRIRAGLKRYRLTAWGRRGIGLLAALARWELTFMPDRAAPLEIDDGIVALLGTVPLVRLPGDTTGVIALTVELEGGAKAKRRAGAIWVRLSRGRVAEIGEGPAPRSAHAWISGPMSAWLDAVIDRRPQLLRTGGVGPHEGVATLLIEALHCQLYGSR